MRLAFRSALLAFALLFSTAASAATIPGSCGQFTCLDDLVLRVQAAAPPPVAAPTPPAVTQNTVTTTGPVASTTTISVGTYAGQALMWVASVFGTTIGAALTALFLRMLKNAGIQGADLLRDRLQEIIVNGLNVGAKAAADRLKGQGDIDVKNEVVAKAVEYTQAHGADILKKLGEDPASEKAIEAIKARIETAINDPATPTPAVLDGAAKADAPAAKP